MATENEPLEIIAANLHGCSSPLCPRFQYGIQKTFENTGSNAQIILMSETMSDSKLALKENHATYVIAGDRPGTGMCISLDPDRLPIFKVTEITQRLQLLMLEDRINIVSLYAPQVGSTDQTKENFKKCLKSLLNQIDSQNDKPILLIGDFNISAAEILGDSSYLQELLQHGRVIRNGEPTQRHGKELDYAVILKEGSANFKISSKVVENATSDHDAIHLVIENFNLVLDTDADLVHQKPKKPVPIPRDPKQIKNFRTKVKKAWGKFLRKNQKVDAILKRTKAAEAKTCACSFKHKQLLDTAYANIREIIVKAAEEVNSKKGYKKKPRVSCSVYDKLYQRLQKKEIGKRRFIKLLKFKTNERNQKNYAYLAKNSKTIKYYKSLKKLMGANLRTRKPRIPLKGITSIYKDIYEPKSFGPEKVKKLKAELKTPKPGESIDIQKFTQLELFEALSSVKKKKASRGPRIELWIMADINDHLLNLFNALLIHGHIPKQLLTADILCLKKDASLPDNTATNFRPIALVESLSKVLELLLKPRISFSFSKNQYAYQQNKGTLNALKDFMSSARDFREKYGTCFIVFLDLSKAFDKLDFNAIAKQMADRMNFPERRIFAEFLTNTCTMLEEVKIYPRRGIRQGGMLSPDIFLQTTDPWLREHEGDRTLGAKGQCFADDTIIIGGLVFRVQDFLDSFADFANDNGLQVNPKKCKIIACCSMSDFNFYNTAGRRLPKFYLNGVELEYVRVYKYLGYLTNSQMNDEDHVKELFSRIRAAILQNKRFFKKANRWLLVRVAKAFIVSKLYGLEFSEKISKNRITRYNYLFNAWFSRNSTNTNQIIEQSPGIDLKSLHEKARSRYDKLDQEK